MRLVTMATALVVLPATSSHGFYDFQTWHSATGQYLQQDKLRLSVVGELRFNDDSSFLWFARLGHNAQYRLNDRWSFDANLSYIRGRVQRGSDSDNLRLELAATPQWQFANRTRFDVRTRLELWLREGSLDEDWRLRVRPRVIVPLKGERGGRALFVSNESFFSEVQKELFQNRFHPIGITLPVGERARVELYTMVFSLRVGGEWNHDLTLGMNWLF